MKRKLALLLGIALVLSVAFVCFIVPSSADADADWATTYAETAWSAVPAEGKTAKVVLRNASSYAEYVTLTDGQSVNFATAPVGCFTAGTVSLNAGVVTMDGLVSNGSATPALVSYGAVKIVIKNGSFKGSLRGDYGENAYSNAMFITSDGTGSLETVGTNGLRNWDSVYIYGDLSANLSGDCFYMDRYAGYSSGTHHEVLFAPQKDSSLATNGQFNALVGFKSTAAAVGKFIIAGGANVSIDLDGEVLSNVALAGIEIRDTNVTVTNGTLGIADVAMTVSGASVVEAPKVAGTVTLEDAAVLKVSEGDGSIVTCNDISGFYVNGTLVKGIVPDWAAKYANEVWNAVEEIGAKAYTPKFSIRFGADRKDYTGTVNFAENPQGSLVGGTISLENGVVTLKDLVWNNPAYDAELILWGASKVILTGETNWYGPIENWPGDPSGAYKEHGAYSPVLVTSEGGTWKSRHGSGNTLRNLDTFVVYGDITLDFTVALFNKDNSSDISGVDASLRHTLVIAPQNDSKIVASNTLISGNGKLNNLVFAGGSEITIEKDKYTFFGVATSNMEILEGTTLNVGGEFGEWSGFATAAGVPAAITLKDSSVLSVEVVYTEPNYPASFINDKVVCEDDAAYFVGGVQVKGPVSESTDTSTDSSTDSTSDTTDSATDSDTGSTDTATDTDTGSVGSTTDTTTDTSTDTDSGSAGSTTDTTTDTSTDTDTGSTDASTDNTTDDTTDDDVKVEIADDWATKYAEDLWAKIPASAYAKVRLRAGATYMTVGDKDYIAEGTTVDFAVTPFGNVIAGTLSVKNGVVTLDGLKYKDGAKDAGLNLIFDNGAGKLVIKNCVWMGDVRGDWGGAAEQSIFVTSDNTGSIKFEGPNSFRVYDSLYIYGNIALDITGDCFWMQNNSYTSGKTTDGTLLIAPLKESNFKVTKTQLNKFIQGVRDVKVIFAGTADSGLITIDLNDLPFTDLLTSLEFVDANVKVVNGTLGFASKAVSVKGASKLDAAALIGSELIVEGSAQVTLAACDIPVEKFTISGTATVNVAGTVHGNPNPGTADVVIAPMVVAALLALGAAVIVSKKKHA